MVKYEQAPQLGLGKESESSVSVEMGPAPDGNAGTKGPPGDGVGAKCKKEDCMVAMAAGGVVLLSFVTVCVALGLWAAAPSSATPSPCCPHGWILNEGRCYFFSDTEANWNVSQRNCSSVGGSLVTMESPQEMDFVQRSKNHTYIWIGLWREDVGQPWKRPNGSLFSNWFPVRGEGWCAYLSEEKISSTWCSNVQFWICSRPALAAGELPGTLQISEG